MASNRRAVPAVAAALLALLLATTHVPARADSPPALRDEATRQFTRCLTDDPSGKDWRDLRNIVPAPAGFLLGKGVIVARVPTASGELYIYRDKAGPIVCGIAVYGAGGDALAADITAALHKAKPNFAPASADFYKGGDIPASARQSYWGAPGGPGVSGVLMISQSPSPAAPSLQVDYHLILIN